MRLINGGYSINFRRYNKRVRNNSHLQESRTLHHGLHNLAEALLWTHHLLRRRRSLRLIHLAWTIQLLTLRNTLISQMMS